MERTVTCSRCNKQYLLPKHSESISIRCTECNAVTRISRSSSGPDLGHHFMESVKLRLLPSRKSGKDNQVQKNKQQSSSSFSNTALSPSTTGDSSSLDIKPFPAVLTSAEAISGRKRALLCGVTYRNKNYSLSGTINDGEEHLPSVDQRYNNVTGFEELGLDEIEPLKYSTGAGQESVSMQEVPMDLTYNAEMEGAYGSSVQFESEEVMLNMADRQQLTTACVWCGVEFNHDAVDAEIQPDSVGFMCPTCKAKISGQLNVVDGGSPLNSHRL